MKQKSNKPVLSIIVPTYNEEKNIASTLESLIKQKCDGEFEIIVSDNGSTDKTLEIAKKYTDKIVFAKKKGTGHARNVGAKHAKGKYLIFFDADTILPEGVLNKIYRVFKQEKYVGFSGVFKFSNRGLRYRIIERCVNFYFITSNYIGETIVPGFCFCIPKSIFKKVGGFRNVFVEDIDLFKRLNKIGKARYFRYFHVITSSRRLEKIGSLSTLDYYLDVTNKWKGVNNFSKRYIDVF